MSENKDKDNKKKKVPLGQRIKASLKRKAPILIVTTLIMLFVVVYLSNRIFYTIGSGEGGVLYKRFFGGTVVDEVYKEGIHAIWPWDKMYIYNARVQETKHEMDVLSVNGLTFHLSLSIRYHPEYDFLGILHKRVGPDYLNKIVIPEVESVLRTLIGNFKPEEVYTTKRDILEKYVLNAKAEVSEKFIVIDEVIIRFIGLPPLIKEAIENKLRQQQLAQEYEFKLQREEKEKERKKIEAEGIRKFQEIVTESLTDKLLKWKGIEATLELAKSENSKIVIIGRAKDGLPLILDIRQEREERAETGGGRGQGAENRRQRTEDRGRGSGDSKQ